MSRKRTVRSADLWFFRNRHYREQDQIVAEMLLRRKATQIFCKNGHATKRDQERHAWCVSHSFALMKKASTAAA
jgi:hypothetical protein